MPRTAPRANRIPAAALAASAALLAGCAGANHDCQSTEAEVSLSPARSSLIAADSVGGLVFSQAIASIDAGDVGPDGTTYVDASEPLD